MAIRLSSGAIVETVVTLAAAALMTLAGFEMLDGMSSPRHELAGPAGPGDVARVQKRDAPAPPVIALPHVDQSFA